MDRRNFFRSALKKGGKAAVKAVDAQVKKQASRWIRPPFAIDELDFILACTRCSDCIEACPHQVIFSLSARLGAKFAGTPALDLLNKGCHLCEDWPCVTACEADALRLPADDAATTDNENVASESEEATKDEQLIPPRLAKVAINEDACLPYNGPECGACFSCCPVPGALTQDMFRPVINPSLCCGCGLCRENCIVDPKAVTIATI